MHHGCSGCSSVCACRIWPEIRVVPRRTYTAAVPAAAALYGLWRLLRNISEARFLPGERLHPAPVVGAALRPGLVCLFSALYYIPFLIVSAAAAFVGLILRVVKNVFAEAVRLKDENDYTI